VLFGVGSVVLACVILLGASTFMRQDYREKSQRLRNLKKMLTTFRSYQPKMSKLQEEQLLYSRRVATLRNLAINRAVWFETLAQVEKMLPEGLWITDFSGTISFDSSSEDNTDKRLDIKGKAVSYDDVNRFISRLKSSAIFSEVKPLSSAFVQEQFGRARKNEEEVEKTEVVQFSISLKLASLK